MEEGENPGPDEYQKTVLWRYEQARRYGLTRLEARLFAESGASLAEMRHLEELGCTPATAARILL